MPLVLPTVGKNEERIGMLLEQFGDGAAFHTEREAIRIQARIDDLESFARACEKQRIVGQRRHRRIAPTLAGQRGVDAVIVEFRPEQFLEWFGAPKSTQQPQYGFSIRTTNHSLPLTKWNWRYNFLYPTNGRIIMTTADFQLSSSSSALRSASINAGAISNLNVTPLRLGFIASPS